MKSRYLLGAGAALAVAFGCAEANAQLAWLGGPYPVTFYVGPEGGWSDRELAAVAVKAGLGPRNLRADTAALVGLAVALATRE